MQSKETFKGGDRDIPYLAQKYCKKTYIRQRLGLILDKESGSSRKKSRKKKWRQDFNFS